MPMRPVASAQPIRDSRDAVVRVANREQMQQREEAFVDALVHPPEEDLGDPLSCQPGVPNELRLQGLEFATVRGIQLGRFDPQLAQQRQHGVAHATVPEREFGNHRLRGIGPERAKRVAGRTSHE
jgi:hypothetical protein